MTQAMFIVPGGAYWTLLALEAAIAAAIGVVAVGGTAALTSRWGPR
jgi:hypothetical protein